MVKKLDKTLIKLAEFKDSLPEISSNGSFLQNEEAHCFVETKNGTYVVCLVNAGSNYVDKYLITIIDKDDYLKLIKIATSLRMSGLHIAFTNNGKTEFLHKYIISLHDDIHIKPDKKSFVEHINGNKYDNRSLNLRYSKNCKRIVEPKRGSNIPEKFQVDINDIPKYVYFKSEGDCGGFTLDISPLNIRKYGNTSDKKSIYYKLEEIKRIIEKTEHQNKQIKKMNILNRNAKILDNIRTFNSILKKCNKFEQLIDYFIMEKPNKYDTHPKLKPDELGRLNILYPPRLAKITSINKMKKKLKSKKDEE